MGRFEVGVVAAFALGRRLTSLTRGIPPSLAWTVRSCRSRRSRRTKVLRHFMHLKGRSLVSVEVDHCQSCLFSKVGGTTPRKSHGRNSTHAIARAYFGVHFWRKHVNNMCTCTSFEAPAFYSGSWRARQPWRSWRSWRSRRWAWRTDDQTALVAALESGLEVVAA